MHSVAPSMMPRWLLLPCGLREAFAAVSRTQDFVQLMRPRAAYQQCVRGSSTAVRGSCLPLARARCGCYSTHAEAALTPVL